MDPYVYLTYLCLLDNDSNINRAFKRWRTHSKIGFGIGGPIVSFAAQMEFKARRAHIYEAQMAWAKIDSGKFIEFLERYGFKK